MGPTIERSCSVPVDVFAGKSERTEQGTLRQIMVAAVITRQLCQLQPSSRQDSGKNLFERRRETSIDLTARQ
jgi:hypothetical protein